jgi:hypothetical protein
MNIQVIACIPTVPILSSTTAIHVHIEFLESAGFQKTAAGWKMNVLHVTYGSRVTTRSGIYATIMPIG